MNQVTDPYSVSVNANSQWSYAIDLNDARLQPKGWLAAQAQHNKALARVKSPTDMLIYELHVRDFSWGDKSVPAPLQGKYAAFAVAQSHGVQHLSKLARAGMTDVHFLPIFDLATVPEADCISPQFVMPKDPASETPQAVIEKLRGRDCYNWGYDPFHFTAPEGSFASNAHDPAARVRELRQMVMALNKLGLRVGMDVVYNHTSAAGQSAQSVLDKIVPGYYQRLNTKGDVETSTCCSNTATEHKMMGR